MLNLALWIGWLIFLFTIAVRSSHKNLFSPQIGFLIGFLLQALYAVFYVRDWSLDFSQTTMLVLFCGSGTFLLVSLLTQPLCDKCRIRLLPQPEQEQCQTAQRGSVARFFAARWKLLLFLAFQVCVLLWLVHFVSGFSGAGLSDGIRILKDTRRVTHEVTDLGMPVLLKLMESFCEAAVYIWSYLLLRGLIHKDKTCAWLLFSNYIAGLLCGAIMSGGRGSVVNPLIAAIAQAYFIYGNYKKWSFKIPYRGICIFALLSAVVIAVFQRSQILLGRYTDNMGGADYLAVYLAAELKNLDIFIRQGVLSADITNCYTLADTVRLLGEIFNIPSWIHYWNNPFRKVNGHFLGNVATTFYAPAHDGGVLAVIFFMAVMAAICQFAFHKAERVRPVEGIRFDILLYSYIYVQILFSFFSNKFYEQVVSPTMIKHLLSWGLIIFVLERVKVGAGLRGIRWVPLFRTRIRSRGVSRRICWMFSPRETKGEVANG